MSVTPLVLPGDHNEFPPVSYNSVTEVEYALESIVDGLENALYRSASPGGTST